MMVQLDDVGIDFTKINDFELFCLTFPKLQAMDVSMIFGDLDLKTFAPAINENSKEVVLIQKDTGVKIDRAVHSMISTCLRKILDLPKDDKAPGNEEARKYMIDRARKKQKRRMRKSKSQGVSQLENYIVALVNSSEFPYDYMSVRDLSIYQFYASLKQIVHKVHYDKTMIGFYAGTIKLEDLPKDSRTWIQTN